MTKATSRTLLAAGFQRLRTTNEFRLMKGEAVAVLQVEFRRNNKLSFRYVGGVSYLPYLHAKDVTRSLAHNDFVWSFQQHNWTEVPQFWTIHDQNSKELDEAARLLQHRIVPSLTERCSEEWLSETLRTPTWNANILDIASVFAEHTLNDDWVSYLTARKSALVASITQRDDGLLAAFDAGLAAHEGQRALPT